MNQHNHIVSALQLEGFDYLTSVIMTDNLLKSFKKATKEKVTYTIGNQEIILVKSKKA